MRLVEPAGFTAFWILANGEKLDAEYLIGKRFTFTDGSAPDVTFVACKDDRRDIRAHALDGGRHWLPLLDIASALDAGILEESPEAPFVW